MRCTRWFAIPAIVLRHRAPPPEASCAEWKTYGGTEWNTRYSGLNRSPPRNVTQLVPRMIFQTGIAKLGSFENTPIVTEGKLLRDHAV